MISDLRLKDNIDDYYAGLDQVLKLRPVTYTYKPETGLDATVLRYGMVAQEIEGVMPDLVQRGQDKIGSIELADMRYFDPTNLVFACVNAIKDLKLEIEQLRAQVEDSRSKAADTQPKASKR
jgi:hypothetical protein